LVLGEPHGTILPHCTYARGAECAL
jgi:hypothetical protein